MIEITLTPRTIGQPGLYLMRWNKHTGLVRIVGQPRDGFKIITPENAAESYSQAIPTNGEIPPDALFSEPLSVVVG